MFGVAAAPRGPGDDCAVLAGSRTDLCVTTDALVEGVHFTLEHFSFRDIGHKALAVNLSDLAAMGATPKWFVCAIAHPAGFPVAQLQQLARGMAALARTSGIELVGGNFTRASELSITVTAAGEVPSGRALTRGGARAGDRLFVTGTLGEARLGLRRLREGATGGAAVRRQRRPVPRLEAGRIALRYARAGIDLSDGLAQDLGHLCRASGVGARLELARLPVGAELRRAFPDPVQRWQFALAGGEDYELLLAVPPRRAEAFRTACKRARIGVTPVGEVVSGGQIMVLSPGGAALSLPPGYDHFPSDRAG